MTSGDGCAIKGMGGGYVTGVDPPHKDVISLKIFYFEGTEPMRSNCVELFRLFMRTRWLE